MSDVEKVEVRSNQKLRHRWNWVFFLLSTMGAGFYTAWSHRVLLAAIGDFVGLAITSLPFLWLLNIYTPFKNQKVNWKLFDFQLALYATFTFASHATIFYLAMGWKAFVQNSTPSTLQDSGTAFVASLLIYGTTTNLAYLTRCPRCTEPFFTKKGLPTHKSFLMPDLDVWPQHCCNHCGLSLISEEASKVRHE